MYVCIYVCMYVDHIYCILCVYEYKGTPTLYVGLNIQTTNDCLNIHIHICTDVGRHVSQKRTNKEL